MNATRGILALRLFRVLLAVWWLIAPAVLGYWGTFPQRQSILCGLLALPMVLLGLVVDGARVFLLMIGTWLALSPALSGQYFGNHAAVMNDAITGVLAVALAITPLTLSARPAAVETARPEGARVGLLARRGGFFRRRRIVA